MQPWKCVFNDTTLIGTGCNREPLQGETARDIDATQCAWFSVYPERYKLEGAVIVERPEWAQEEADREAAKQLEIDALAARVAELEAAKEDSGVHKYTPQQVRNYIDAQFAAASTVAQVKAVIVDVLKKIAVYSLK